MISNDIDIHLIIVEKTFKFLYSYMVKIYSFKTISYIYNICQNEKDCY